ncbi:uncharacterized protein B0H64DRAFT_31078 [Chaetomium fimeti]|uniref:Uncharacterized protein n=1 Tax=Chaetomium fimeti TaxID=1854472 RepID=A0AAE0LXB6_9PEZI|nr:hypothetical protein B0H64DRAFT_31078 [Chaetomium fimeti]
MRRVLLAPSPSDRHVDPLPGNPPFLRKEGSCWKGRDGFLLSPVLGTGFLGLGQRVSWGHGCSPAPATRDERLITPSFSSDELSAALQKDAWYLTPRYDVRHKHPPRLLLSLRESANRWLHSPSRENTAGVDGERDRGSQNSRPWNGALYDRPGRIPSVPRYPRVRTRCRRIKTMTGLEAGVTNMKVQSLETFNFGPE